MAKICSAGVFALPPESSAQDPPLDRVKLLGQHAVQFSYFFGWVGGLGGVVGEVRYRANLSQS